MSRFKGFQIVILSILLFVLIAAALVLFHTCSIPAEEPEQVPEEPVQVKVEPKTQVEPEPETPVQAEPESVVIEKPVIVVEPEPQPEPVESDRGPVIEAQPEPQPEPEPMPETVVMEPLEEPPVPEAPDLDWIVDVKPYEGVSVFNPLEEDIDWSEFVFSDEEIILPDGTYYAQLIINDAAYGEIEFNQIDGSPYFSKLDLMAELLGTLADDFYSEFFSYESDYLPMSYLQEMCNGVKYDSNNLTLSLSFDSSKVPVQTLSLGTSSYSTLRQNYEVAGNITLEPAHFSFTSNISMYVNVPYEVDKEFSFENLTGSISFSNTFSFWNMTFNLPFSVSYMRNSGISPSLGSWNGYIDFPDYNIRLSFGNVGNSGFTTGTPFGLTLEKSYGYGTGSAMTNQYAETITLTEDSHVEIKVNGNVVYSKNLSLGVYRLTDFVFTQGSNEILVTIHPIAMGEDTSEDQVLTFGQNYDSSLMAKGETIWRFGVSVPKISRPSESSGGYDFGFVVPDIPRYSSDAGFVGQENVFDMGSLSVFWDQTVGITHEYTQTHSFTFVYERSDGTETQSPAYSSTFGASVSGILATGIGTTRATFSGMLSSEHPDRNSMSVSLSQGFVWAPLKPLSFSTSYSLNNDIQTLSLSLGYSFSIKGVKIGTTLSGSYKMPSFSGEPVKNPLNWTGGVSLSTTLGKRGSFSMNTTINQDFTFYGTASVSFSYGSSNVNSSVSTNNFNTLVGNVGVTFRPGSNSRSSFQINASSINLLELDFTKVPSHTLSAAWSRSGDIVSMAFRAQASNMYKRFNGSFSLNTAFVFADGYVSMTNSIYGPFMLVAPSKGLGNATIAVSSATDSSTVVSRKVLGNVLYTRLNMYRPNNILIYASNGSLFTSSGSFLFKVTPLARQGFLARISLESSVAISGVLRQNEYDVYDSYSSPVYKVEVAENGVDVISMEIDGSTYFFTDVDGRFIISDLPSGVYMFDLNIGGQWYAAFFEVPTVEEPGYVALFKDFVGSDVDLYAETMQKYNVKSFDSSYAGSVYLEFDRYITEDEYWDMLFTLADEELENDVMWDYFDDDVDLSDYTYQEIE